MPDSNDPEDGTWVLGPAAITSQEITLVRDKIEEIMGNGYDLEQMINAVNTSTVEPNSDTPTLNRTLTNILGTSASDFGDRSTFQDAEGWLQALVENLGADDEDPYVDQLTTAQRDELFAAEAAGLLVFPRSTMVRRVRVPGTSKYRNQNRRRLAIASVANQTEIPTAEVTRLWESPMHALDTFVLEKSATILNENLPPLTDDDASYDRWCAEKAKRKNLVNSSKRNAKKRLSIRVALYRALKADNLITTAKIAARTKRVNK